MNVNTKAAFHHRERKVLQKIVADKIRALVREIERERAQGKDVAEKERKLESWMDALYHM